MRDEVPAPILGLAWHRGRRLTPTQLAFIELARELCPAVAGAHAAALTPVAA